MSRPTRKDKEVRLLQEHILESTQRLYANKDIEDATMDEIARAAGYTKRTIYAYFNSKEEIQIAMLLRGFRQRWQMQRKAMETQSEPEEKLRAFGQAYFRFSRQNRSHLRLFAYLDYRGIDPAIARPEIFNAYRDLNEEALQQLRMVMEEGVRQGVFRQGLDITMTISHFVYTLRIIINRAFSRSYSFAHFVPGKYFQGYLELFLRAIMSGEKTTGKPGKRSMIKRKAL